MIDSIPHKSLEISACLVMNIYTTSCLSGGSFLDPNMDSVSFVNEDHRIGKKGSFHTILETAGERLAASWLTYPSEKYESQLG